MDSKKTVIIAIIGVMTAVLVAVMIFSSQKVREQEQAQEEPSQQTQPAKSLDAEAVMGAEEEATERQPNTVVSILHQTPELSNFSQLITEAGLEQDLEEAGPYTLFVPSNSAIEQLSKEQQKSISEDEEEREAFIMQHIVPGALEPKDLGKEQNIQSLNTDIITVTQDERNIRINEQSTASQVESTANNGVVYIVDTVVNEK